MPLGKYYCDYCDKQFQDTPAARRRHLQGVVHQRAKALWYDSLRSSSQLGLDQVQDPRSVGKGVCNRFVLTVILAANCCLESDYRLLFLNPKGSCRYGDSCKYYHPKKNLDNMYTQGTEGTSSVTNVQSRGIPGTALFLQLYFVEIKWEHRCKIYPPRCGLRQRVDIHPYPWSIGDKCAF
ncbi:UNVERIFIED_CONTAM: Zinc finger CCCH domain-containing protein 3 [Sesamum latifolium]|uniref:Zinc finger CCCH domain-containing protein 3 n=1 Tax=Sesamum latifolium TaxID=2727402 RepID=A0AAW2V3T2_9LAMI